MRILPSKKLTILATAILLVVAAVKNEVISATPTDHQQVRGYPKAKAIGELNFPSSQYHWDKIPNKTVSAPYRDWKIYGENFIRYTLTFDFYMEYNRQYYEIVYAYKIPTFYLSRAEPNLQNATPLQINAYLYSQKPLMFDELPLVKFSTPADDFYLEKPSITTRFECENCDYSIKLFYEQMTPRNAPPVRRIDILIKDTRPWTGAGRAQSERGIEFTLSNIPKEIAGWMESNPIKVEIFATDESSVPSYNSGYNKSFQIEAKDVALTESPPDSGLYKAIFLKRELSRSIYKSIEFNIAPGIRFPFNGSNGSFSLDLKNKIERNRLTLKDDLYKEPIANAKIRCSYGDIRYEKTSDSRGTFDLPKYKEGYELIGLTITANNFEDTNPFIFDNSTKTIFMTPEEIKNEIKLYFGDEPVSEGRIKVSYLNGRSPRQIALPSKLLLPYGARQIKVDLLDNLLKQYKIDVDIHASKRWNSTEDFRVELVERCPRVSLTIKVDLPENSPAPSKKAKVRRIDTVADGIDLTEETELPIVDGQIRDDRFPPDCTQLYEVALIGDPCCEDFKEKIPTDSFKKNADGTLFSDTSSPAFPRKPGVAILVDMSKPMNDYYEEVKHALKEALNREFKTNKLYVGVARYADKLVDLYDALAEDAGSNDTNCSVVRRKVNEYMEIKPEDKRMSNMIPQLNQVAKKLAGHNDNGESKRNKILYIIPSFSNFAPSDVALKQLHLKNIDLYIVEVFNPDGVLKKEYAKELTNYKDDPEEEPGHVYKPVPKDKLADRLVEAIETLAR